MDALITADKHDYNTDNDNDDNDNDDNDHDDNDFDATSFKKSWQTLRTKMLPFCSPLHRASDNDRDRV